MSRTAPRRSAASAHAGRGRNASPFRIVPWDDDFLLRIHDLADRMTGGCPGKAVIVFPLNRPRRYLLDIYRHQVEAPMLLPRIINSSQLIQSCLESWTRHVPRAASTLDQAAIMKESVLAVARGGEPGSPLAKLAESLEGEDGMARFFPWGVRLARLLDECAGHMVNAQDMRHIDDLVAPYAVALLGSLSRIQEDYRARLLSRGLSTPGIDSQRAALLAGAGPDLPLKLQGKSLIIAGFVRLTDSQDRLFRYLWERGAEICLHTDPAILSGGGHWSCGDHREWLARWKTRGELMGKSRASGPDIRFFAGYDLHSQLLELKNRLEDAPAEGESRAVVLSHDSLLMPALHHIPEKNINISLGYPLKRSLLAQLVERILKARESMDSSGRVHWKALMALIRHPYIRMLAVSGPEEDSVLPVRPFLSLMETALRSGARMVDAELCARDLLDDRLGDLERGPRAADLAEENGQLLEKCIEVLVTDWRSVDSLDALAARMRALCQLLLEYGRHIWPRFPLDAECLARLMQSVIPELSDNAMAQEKLSLSSLFAVLRQSLSEQRVPFEADPLTGLQILGTLETRLLHFDRVYMLDLTEDALPGAPARDPLLPDSLRDMLGLPDNSRRDMLAAHTFHRLIAGAKEVHLFWQEGVQTGVMDGKKVRSRFVEEAVWRVEQRLGRRLETGEGPLSAAAFPMTDPPMPVRRAIARSRAINENMDALLDRPLAPTSLDEYLSCPARFFHKHVCGMRELKEVLEEDDHRGVGDMLHAVLEEACRPFVGRPMPAGSLDAETLAELFHRHLGLSGLSQNLPAESRFMLEAAGPLRLKDFAERQPDVLEVLALEHEAKASLEMGDRRFSLFGKLDRLDRRDEGIVILDYKSGSTSRQIRPAFWQDEMLWEAMREWRPGLPDPLPDLAESLPSIQLPCYIYLCANDPRLSGHLRLAPLADASLVLLADKGDEMPLLGRDLSEEERRAIIEERIPELLRFVLRHMAEAETFAPRPTKRCEKCPFRTACESTA